MLRLEGSPNVLDVKIECAFLDIRYKYNTNQTFMLSEETPMKTEPGPIVTSPWKPKADYKLLFCSS